MIAPKHRLLAGLVLLVTTSCHEGGGSDIGPRLPRGPGYDYRVLVHDDAGRPVVGAIVSVSGLTTTATTAHTGRAFLRDFASGSRRVTVDGSQAAATDRSRLGTLTLGAVLPDGDELPYVVYLPDHASSFGLTLNTGVQAGPATLDDDPAAAPADPERSGARLTIAAGEQVTFGTAGSVELRTARLSVGHLPGTLSNGGTVMLAARGIYIHPAGVTFQNGIGLSIPDDLGLSASQAVDLYWLDPATGRWLAVGSGAEAGGRIVAAAPAGPIRNGGLYCFGLPALSTTQITGRVVDVEGQPLPGVLVRAPQSSTRSRGDGRFTLPALARTDMQGADRNVAVELHGGRNYLPSGTQVAVSLNGATVTLANDVELATHPSTNVRLLLINRGEVVPNRRFRVNGRLFLSDAETLIKDDGIANLEEVAVDVTGYVSTVPNDINSVYRTRSLLFLSPALDNASSIFSDEFGWRQSLNGGSLVESIDKFGTGSLLSTHVIVGDVPGTGHAGQTDLNGFLGVNVPRGSVVTTVRKTELAGQVAYSAFGMASAIDGRFEMPTERVRRRFGAFRRFGMAQGRLTGLVGSDTLRARSSGSMTRQDFYDQTLFGRTGARRAPVQQLPTTVVPDYRLGVPAGVGHIAGAEGSTVGGVFALQQLGLAEVTAVEGQVVTQDIPLVAANTGYLVRSALTALDATIQTTDLRFDLAGERANGLVADLVRDVGGASIAVNAADVTLNLPPLPAGVVRYVAALRGSSLTAGVTRSQQIVADLDGTNVPAVTQVPVPVVTSPTAGATVASTGFTVDFTLPVECHYGLVQLRWEGANEVRDWTVAVPRYATQVRFFQLPPQVRDDKQNSYQVLKAASNWKLTVFVGRVGGGLLLDPRLTYDEAYLRILSNLVGMGEAERLENGFASYSIDLTLN